jgi:hypothetical protein
LAALPRQRAPLARRWQLMPDLPIARFFNPHASLIAICAPLRAMEE